ncbi:MAG: PorP/SprF family type IX secretion system membrane protein [Bacteroidales bacterium]|nr:PorP/SprF family type IX secretion system membrane protein [Bacteroidales bacterium]
MIRLTPQKAPLCIIVFTILILHSYVATGQQSPFYPVSYRIFNPFVFNPAVAGSKDYSSYDIILSNRGSENSLMGSFNTRLSKVTDNYVSSLPAPEFTNIGVGGFIFREQIGNARNTGFGASASYHLATDRDAKSFFSAGATVKAIYHDFAGDTELSIPEFNTFRPTADAGIYYYSPGFYTGVSVTNLFFVTDVADTLGLYITPITPMLFFHAGYKFIISDLDNMIIEPIIILEYPCKEPAKFEEIIKPGFRFYSGALSAGTFLNDLKRLSFFMQFKYKKTSLGAYFELPYNTAYYKEPMIAEISLGINLSAIKSGYQKNNHW